MPQITDSFFEDSAETCSLNSSTTNDEPIPDSIEWFYSNINSYYMSDIKIAHLNINSIQNKVDEVKNMLNRNMFDILFIGETKLDDTFPANLLQHPGYRLIRQDHRRGAGGLMVFVRENLSAYRRRKLEPKSVETLCLDVTDLRKHRFMVCACYRSEKVNKLSEFISSLTAAVELMYKCRQEIVLIGDFNMDMLIDEETGRTENKAIKKL